MVNEVRKEPFLAVKAPKYGQKFPVSEIFTIFAHRITKICEYEE